MAPWAYEFPVTHLVQALKYEGALANARVFGTRMAAQALREQADDPRPDAALVVPIPLHPSRLVERGFNQSWELARPLAQALRLPARHDLLLRWRETEHQTSLSRDARNANLRGAFMPAPGARASLTGKHVALVDDVMTTGVSAAQAAQALLEAGATRVDVWLLARTPEVPATQ